MSVHDRQRKLAIGDEFDLRLIDESFRRDMSALITFANRAGYFCHWCECM